MKTCQHSMRKRTRRQLFLQMKSFRSSNMLCLQQQQLGKNPSPLVFVQSIQTFSSNFFRLVNIVGCVKPRFFIRIPVLYAIWYHGRIWSQDQTQLRGLLVLKTSVMLLVHPSTWSTATEMEYLVFLSGRLKYVKAGKKGLNFSCAICFNHIGDNYIVYGHRAK